VDIISAFSYDVRRSKDEDVELISGQQVSPNSLIDVFPSILIGQNSYIAIHRSKGEGWGKIQFSHWIHRCFRQNSFFLIRRKGRKIYIR
jgi:hypothetical protein